MTETTKDTAERLIARMIRELAIKETLAKYASNGDVMNALFDAGVDRWDNAACGLMGKALDDFAKDGTHALTTIYQCAAELAHEMAHGIN